MHRHSRLFVRSRAVLLGLNLLMNAQIQNDQGGNPEQEDQILHRATSRPVKWQVTSISILVRPHAGRKFTDHIAWLTSITDKEPTSETLVDPLNLVFEIGRESGSRKVNVGQPESRA
jgi:hypothetical protein